MRKGISRQTVNGIFQVQKRDFGVGTMATGLAFAAISGGISCIQILKPYQKGVWMAFGKFQNVKGEGMRLSIPFYHSVQVVDMRSTMIELPEQNIMGVGENVTTFVDGTVQFRVVDPMKATFEVDDYKVNTAERAQNAIREHLGGMDFDDINRDRVKLNSVLLEDMKPLEDEWGVKVEKLQLRNVKVAKSLEEDMARTAKAKRSAESKIIQAKANIATSQQYHEAAKLYLDNPNTMRLRELDMLQAIADKPSTKFVFYPMDFHRIAIDPKKKEEVQKVLTEQTDYFMSQLNRELTKHQ